MEVPGAVCGIRKLCENGYEKLSWNWFFDKLSDMNKSVDPWREETHAAPGLLWPSGGPTVE